MTTINTPTPKDRYDAAMAELAAAIEATSIDRWMEAITAVAELTKERDRLAALLDGVLADDPQAIRDAAAWLAANRPEEVEG